MSSRIDAKVWLLLAGLFIAALFSCIANAGCYKCTTVNNFPTTITSGISDEEINSLLAGGAHQFDWSTTNWQLSLTTAMNASDWDSENQFSAALGKRFGKDSAIPNALWHVGWTPVADDDYVIFGGTIVFD